MRKILLTFTLIYVVLQSNAFAEKVRVYTDYSPVRILSITNNADFEVEANKSGLKGNFKEIEASELPTSREDRNAWKFTGGQIKTDANLKSEIKKETDARDAAIEKLKSSSGLTDKEIEMLGIRGV